MIDPAWIIGMATLLSCGALVAIGLALAVADWLRDRRWRWPK